MKIVVVDPSRVVLKVLKGTLESAGHEVISFADGGQALELLRIDPGINVLLTSLQFEGVSGLALVRSARALAGSRRALYVIVMSSSSERSTLVDALDSGADDFIGKPPAEEELLARLRVAGRVADLQRDLIRLATIDAMTGVLNRRAFFEAAATLDRSTPDAVAIFDIDKFKQINDTFGHAAGDVAIIAVARSAAERALVGRLGGEEFAMLLPGRDVGAAVALCEDVRGEIAALGFGDINPELTLTCSFGAGDWRPDESIDAALKRADVALYAAKTGERNRVIAATAGAHAAGEAVVVSGSPPARRRAAR